MASNKRFLRLQSRKAIENHINEFWAMQCSNYVLTGTALQVSTNWSSDGRELKIPLLLISV